MKKNNLVLFGTSVLLSLVVYASGQVQPINEVFEPVGNFPKDKFVKVAVVQVGPELAQVGISAEEAEVLKQVNRETLEQHIREAVSKGAEIVITPEMGVVGYPDIPELPSEDDNFRNREDIEPYLEPVVGQGATSAQFFGNLAKELGVYIQYGLAEIDKQTDLIHNTAVAVDPKGNVIGAHRKVGLFKQESDYFSPGTSATTYQTPAGKIGMLICADVYHSSLLASYQRYKVDVLALSTSWAQMNTGMGYFIAAAKRVQSYLLAANHPYFPDTGVVNPNGTLQSHIRQTDGIAYGYLPRK